MQVGGDIFDITFPAFIETDSEIILVLVNEKRNMSTEFHHQSGQSVGSTFYLLHDRKATSGIRSAMELFSRYNRRE